MLEEMGLIKERARILIMSSMGIVPSTRRMAGLQCEGIW